MRKGHDLPEGPGGVMKKARKALALNTKVVDKFWKSRDYRDLERKNKRLEERLRLLLRAAKAFAYGSGSLVQQSENWLVLRQEIESASLELGTFLRAKE